MSDPGNKDSPLKPSSVHRNPPCGKCAHDCDHDAKVRKDNAKRVWSAKGSQENIGRHLDILIS